MNKTVNAIRQLGKVYNFPSTTLPLLLQRKHQILQGVTQNGCICIKNVQLSQKELVEFTKAIWPRIVVLPQGWSLNNKIKEFPQIVRVGNVLLDGSMKDSSKESIFWHQDGDFWGPNRKHIYSCLLSKLEPQEGGYTYFMDLDKAVEYLKFKKPQIYEELKNGYGYLDVQLIDDFKNNKAKNQLGIQSPTYHQIIKKDKKTGKQILYLSGQKLVTKKDRKQSPLVFDDLCNMLQKQIGAYIHKWKKGDFVIWDNTQVMHKAEGKTIKGKRLLIRTQGSFEL